MTPISCTVRADTLLVVAWLALNTRRTVDQQAGTMVEWHALALKRAVFGELLHSPHCLAAVRLYGWPKLDTSPASKCPRRLPLRLTPEHLAMIDAMTERSGRDRRGQLSAVLEDYARTLRPRSSS